MFKGFKIYDINGIHQHENFHIPISTPLLESRVQMGSTMAIFPIHCSRIL